MPGDVAELERVVDGLPEGWRRVRLGEVFTERKEKGRIGLPVASVSIEHGLVLRSSLDRRVASDLLPEGHALVRKGDIAYNMMRMWQGACGLAEADCIISPAYVVMTPLADVEPMFAHIALRSEPMISLLHGYSQGIVDDRLRLYPAAFAQVPINLPPLDEQRRIAEVLRSVDEAIAAAEAAASMAEKLLIRVRDQIISQPIWDTATLADAASGGLFTDGDWVESKDQDPDGKVRLIQLADIGDGFFVDKSQRYLTMEKAHQLRCTFLEEGDLLVARMPEPLGRCCLFPAINQPSVTVVDVCVVRASRTTSNRYLNHALATSEFRSQVLACASGTTRTRVSRGNLGRLELAMPPLAEQEAIADELDQISIVAGRQRQAAERLKGLKSGLMSDLLSGRMRVPA